MLLLSHIEGEGKEREEVAESNHHLDCLRVLNQVTGNCIIGNAESECSIEIHLI